MVMGEWRVTPHSTCKIVAKMKTAHGLVTTNRNDARSGKWVNADELRSIKNIALDIIEMCEEIRAIQIERMENE